MLAGEEVKVGRHVFTIPDGFEIAQVAGPPLVDRPIVADFDEAGHLYVADSAGVNDKVQKQLETRPHRIVRLTDTNQDGVYDESVVFADKMMFPEGLLCHDGAVYCAAPPSIWKLEDTNGDGVADRRTEWFKGGTLTGCANDLHGPYLGPAGWIYWTKGAFAKMDLEMGDGSRLTDSAAHLFRARPDGSDLESFAAGGMDNPVDISFSEAGDVFFTSTFLVQPGNGKRDGLIHALYGGVFPKRHGVIDSLPRTGELMPALTHLGPAAPAGLTTYRSRVFGDTFRGNLFSALFNMRKVMRHRLIREGATHRTVDSDFVVSDQVDFHPTDVQEDADGSLLIMDTGGWYKLCCPTSVIAKPEVFGGIFRVRRKEAPVIEDPRGLKIAWANQDPAALVPLLNDARPMVRKRAITVLASRGEAVLPLLQSVLSEKRSEAAALGALWVAARIRTREGAATARLALSSPYDDVKQAGAYVCGLRRDQAGFKELLTLLDSGNLAVRREAATALGRLGNPAASEALLSAHTAYGQPARNDRFLEHALTFALIEINDPRTARRHLPARGEFGRSINGLRALWALDHMKDGNLKPGEVTRSLGNKSQVLPILRRHPEWEAEIAVYYHEFLRSDPVLGDREGATDHGLQEFLHLPKVARVVSDVLLEDPARVAALHTIRRSVDGGGFNEARPMPDTLVPGLEQVVLAGGLFSIRQLKGIKASQLTPALERVLSKQAGDNLHKDHLESIRTLASCAKQLPGTAFETVISMIGTTRWLEAALVITKAKLSDAQMVVLVEALPRCGVAEISLLLEPFRKGGSVQLGKVLARSLAVTPALRSVSAADLAKIAAAFPKEVRALINDARPKDPGSKELEARLDSMEANLPEGDRRRGHQIFKSTKAACATCHRLAYAGGALGPDLTRIGAIRSRRDLLESIVAPSASYARGYEPMIVTTSKGDTHMGLLRHRSASVVLTDIAGRTTEIRTGDIKELRLAPASLMPAGIDQALSPQELADLIVFLKSLK
jgi:putative membrane-bound dehydrogenase-like protein